MPAKGFTEEGRSVTVVIEWPGIGNLGTFARRTGGNAGSETTKFPPGGGQKEVVLRGRQTMGDEVVVAKLLTPAELPKRNALLEARGRARMIVSDLVLDEDDNAVDDPMTWTGVFQEFRYPDADSTSNDPALLELVMDPEDVGA